MSRKTWKLAVGALALGGLVACGHAKSAGRADADTGSEKLSDSIRQAKHGDEKMLPYDLNHDGKPDVWDFTVVSKGPDGREIDRLVRKELDINFDGRVDIVRFYDEREQLSKELMDLDFDGKIDQANYYEKGLLVRKERYLGAHGKPDEWVYYEKGHIVRKERDLHGSGKVDYWEYWEGDQVDRVGEDLDGDGNVDKWTKNPNSES